MGNAADRRRIDTTVPMGREWFPSPRRVRGQLAQQTAVAVVTEGCARRSAGVSPEVRRRREEFVMSGIDKAKNKAQELAGEGKEAVGDATDNRDLQAEGEKDQAAGNLKQAGEKVKDVFK
jgi:uncharacterized protein YjbJ (UPF0337 family)